MRIVHHYIDSVHGHRFIQSSWGCINQMQLAQGYQLADLALVLPAFG